MLIMGPQNGEENTSMIDFLLWSKWSQVLLPHRKMDDVTKNVIVNNYTKAFLNAQSTAGCLPYPSDGRLVCS